MSQCAKCGKEDSYIEDFGYCREHGVGKGDEAMKTTTKVKHTPTPWTYGVYEMTETMRIRLEKPQSCVCLPDDPNRAYDPNHGPMMVVALCGDAMDEQSRADVEFIVRAVNSHEALLEVAKLGLKGLIQGGAKAEAAKASLQKAIAKAEARP